MRKTAIDKAIDALEAEKKVIELAIAKLRAAQEKKPAAAPRPRRMSGPLGITGQANVVEGTAK